MDQRALQLVDLLPQYHAIGTHAHSALQGILSIDTGRYITCDTLFEKLCTAECEKCGDFGGYLYIITCRRVCFLCFSFDDSYRPLLFMKAKELYGLSRHVLDGLPRMRTVRGRYQEFQITVGNSTILVDHDSALDVGLVLHGRWVRLEHMWRTRRRKE